MDTQTHMGVVPGYLVLDGGVGTEIINIVGQHQHQDPVWSSRVLIQKEDVVKQVHRNFLTHGADVIMTNTYKPSVENMMEHAGMTWDESLEFFRKASRIAREVRDEVWAELQQLGSDRCRPLVAGGQVGAYGGRTFTASEYTGTYVENMTIEEMVAGHVDKARALVEGGVDILAFETIPAAVEGHVVAELMKQLPGSKAWVAFSCKDGKHTCHGELFSDAVMTSLLSDQIVAVGVNCSKPEFVTSLLQQIPDEVKKRKKIIVYPNSGQVWEAKKKFWYWDDVTIEQPLKDFVPEWIKHGADWIGGCCNVTPRDISDIRDVMLKTVTSGSSDS